MKKALCGAAFVFVSFLLQSTLFSQFNIGGIVPNLLIIVIASLGFLNGKRSGLIAGFFGGLLLDLFFGSVYGVNALIYMYVGYVNGYFKKILFPEDIKLPLVMIAGSDLAYNLVYYVFMFMFKGKFQIFYYMFHVIIPEIVYTAVIACFLYPLIHTLFKKIDTYEKKGEQTIV